jgi:hypothetical protein
LNFKYLNWYYLSINTRDSALSSNIIDKVNQNERPLSPRFEALKILINFDFMAKQGEVKRAQELNQLLKKVEGNFYHADMTAMIVIRFNFYIITEDFKSAQKELAKLKTIRKNQLSENYKYMSSLLIFLLYSKPLYTGLIPLPSKTLFLVFISSLTKYYETLGRELIRFYGFSLKVEFNLVNYILIEK